jgi:DNA-binding Xre family transcriptional regulator
MTMPKIYWKKLATSVRLFMLHDLGGASVREAARHIGMDKSALQRLRSGKPVTAENYAHICLWLGCSADKYLSSARFRG